MCDFQVTQVSAFTINGDNENVTCDLNAVNAIFSDIDVFQVELCPGKTLAKIFTPDQETAKTVRNILQANIDKICYTEDTVLKVENTNNLPISDIRTRLWGNVEIRAISQCDGNVYVQVPPEYLKFAQDILEACEEDLPIIPCYKQVPLDCVCTLVPLSVVQSVGNSDSGDDINFIDVSINVSKAGNSLYVAVQYIFSSSPSTVSVTDSISPTAFIQDKTTDVSGNENISEVWHKDNVTAGPHTISIFLSSTCVFLSAQVVEIQGMANPSIDPNTTGLGPQGSGVIAQDSLTPTFNNELGFMSVCVSGGNVNISGSDGSVIIPPVNTSSNGKGAALKKLLDGAGILQSMKANLSANTTWSASAVGIIPETCPVTNCHFPVPNCNFQYPCISCKQCEKSKKSKKH